MRSVILYGLSVAAVGLATLASVSGAEDAPAAPVTPQNATAAAAAPSVPADVEKAMQQPEGAERTKAIVASAQEWAKKEPMAALAWSLKLPPALARNVAGWVAGACGRTHGKETADLVVQNKAYYALHGTLVSWGLVDHTPACEWALAAPKELRPVSIFSAADGFCRKDPAAAGEWVLTVPGDDDRAAAVDGVAMMWFRSNVPGISAWIKKLKPADAKLAAKIGVWDATNNRFRGKNRGEKDDAAIKAFLDEVAFSDADREEIMKTPPPSFDPPKQ